MTAPVIDLSPAARAARYRARLAARRRARRAAWRASGGDPAAYRRIILAWLHTSRTRP
jgi:hypothetical protein